MQEHFCLDAAICLPRLNRFLSALRQFSTLNCKQSNRPTKNDFLKSKSFIVKVELTNNDDVSGIKFSYLGLNFQV